MRKVKHSLYNTYRSNKINVNAFPCICIQHLSDIGMCDNFALTSRDLWESHNIPRSQLLHLTNDRKRIPSFQSTILNPRALEQNFSEDRMSILSRFKGFYHLNVIQKVKYCFLFQVKIYLSERERSHTCPPPGGRRGGQRKKEKWTLRQAGSPAGGSIPGP